jgi:hypothetical protein
MDPRGQFVCYLVAFVLFVLAGLWPNPRTPNLVALGLASAVFVLLYTAWQAI